MAMWVQIATLGLGPLGLVLGFAAGRITAGEPFNDVDMDDEEYGIDPVDGWDEEESEAGYGHPRPTPSPPAWPWSATPMTRRPRSAPRSR